MLSVCEKETCVFQLVVMSAIVCFRCADRHKRAQIDREKLLIF